MPHMKVSGQAHLSKSSNYQGPSGTTERGEYHLNYPSHFRRALAIDCPTTHPDICQVKLRIHRSAGLGFEEVYSLTDKAVRPALPGLRVKPHTPHSILLTYRASSVSL